MATHLEPNTSTSNSNAGVAHPTKEWTGRAVISLVIASLTIEFTRQYFQASLNLVVSEFIILIACAILFSPAFYLVMRRKGGTMAKCSLVLGIALVAMSRIIIMIDSMEWLQVQSTDTGIRETIRHARTLCQVMGLVTLFSTIYFALLTSLQAESALEKENAFRKAIIENSAEGLCVCQFLNAFPHVLFTVWSSRMTEIFGYTLTEINQLGVYETLIPSADSRQRAIERMKCARAGDNLSGDELDVVDRHGRRRIISVSSTRLQWNDNQVHLLLHVSDITRRKQSEELLRQSERRFRETLERAQLIAIEIDPNGRIIFCNEFLLDLTGWKSEEVVGHDWFDLFLPEDQQVDIRAVVDAILETSTAYAHYENPIKTRDGTLRHIRWNNTPVRGADGQITSIISLGEDVTERKKMEELLRVNEENLRSLFDTIHEPVFLVERDGTILAVNESFAARFETSVADCIGKSLYSFSPPSLRDRRREYFAEVLRTGRTVSFEDEREGHWAHHNLTPVLNSNGEIERIAGYVMDMTERRVAEAENAKLEEQLQQAQKMESVGRLAGGVAHDFNNMLGVILGHIDLAIEQVEPSSPLLADLAEVRSAAERSADLTRQLLAFARKQTVAPRVLNLNETVEGMLKMLQRLIGENITLVWEPGNALWPVNVDPSQIDQILANLAVNARDAIADVGRITIKTSNCVVDNAYAAEHPSMAPGDYVQVMIEDNGSGMDNDILAHIFEPFFTTKGVGEGTGLGLATVYGAVKQNNGFIDALSEPGQGTTFRIYLPRHDGSITQRPLERIDRQLTSGHETILLVEDEPGILKLTTLLLQKDGYTVLPANTPGDAIRIAQEYDGEIHLLMTDVVMPDMNGRDLAHNILRYHPNIQRLFMSGYTADLIAHHGVLEEGVHFIQKPFSTQNLAAKVRKALQQRNFVN